MLHTVPSGRLSLSHESRLTLVPPDPVGSLRLSKRVIPFCFADASPQRRRYTTDLAPKFRLLLVRPHFSQWNQCMAR